VTHYKLIIACKKRKYVQSNKEIVSLSKMRRKADETSFNFFGCVVSRKARRPGDRAVARVILTPMVERPVVGSSSARPTIPTGVFLHFLRYCFSRVESSQILPLSRCLSRVESQRDSGASVAYEALNGFDDLFKDAIFKSTCSCRVCLCT
jgi:hypothetical protein